MLLAGPRVPIDLSGDLRLYETATPLLTGWPQAEPDISSTTAGLDLRQGDGDWILSPRGAPVEPLSFAPGYEACNGLVGGLIGEYVCQDPDLISVHAAAAVSASGALVAVADAFAGKSTLATALAWQGCPLICDDRVVIAAGPPVRARALGVAAKMRRPLPADAPADYVAFIEEAALSTWPDVAPLSLGADHQLAFGEERPLAAWLLPRRDPGHEGVTLQEVAPAAVVRALAEQTFAPHLPLADLMRRAADLTGAAACYRLDYADSFAAARFLADRFGVPS